jgi:CheY-like chemotaxis protein
MKKTKIFYADDDLDDIEIFVEAVNRMVENGIANIDIEVFQDGHSLLSAIKTQENQGDEVIFLDINMPGKNGFQILKEIRQDDKLKPIPVIMYSTSSDAHTINTSRETGANAYAIKPSDFHTLTSIIKKVCNINWNEFKADAKNFHFRA